MAKKSNQPTTVINNYYYGLPESIRSTHVEGVNNQMNFGKLANVGALVALAAAALGHTLFGYSGLELVAGGLFLSAGADLIEDVLS